jgi:DAK2 domain fusion protein YloV
VLAVLVVRSWCREALAALGRAREEIDALNVYPVPDGDTGTNLYLTVESLVEEMDQSPDGTGLPETLAAAVHGALLGARGNSGVILSQLIRGAVSGLGAAVQVDARTFADALVSAADAGYAAVAQPVEGTMLTVIRGAADAARGAADAGHDLQETARAAALGAQDALARTTDLLEPLRRAGVVDAGGRGVTVLLDCLVGGLTGQSPQRAPGRGQARSGAVPVVDQEASGPDGGPAFEVMYLLQADDEQVAALRGELAGLGDSLLVVGGSGLWNVHVHVDDAGAAIEAGVRAGRPYRIKVSHFAEQVARQRAGRESVGRAVIAFLPAEGLVELARGVGAQVVLAGPGRRPSTRDVLEAVQQAHASEVVVLPDDRDTVPVAEAAAELARAGGLRVAVLPSRAVVQVLAALAVHDPGRRFEEDVVAMTAAARATRTGAVTRAVRESLTSVGVCNEGDVLGLVDEEVVVIGSDVDVVARELLDRLLNAGGELVTLVSGENAPDGLTSGLEDYLRRSHPEVEAGVYVGGQQHYPLLLGVE